MDKEMEQSDMAKVTQTNLEPQLRDPAPLFYLVLSSAVRKHSGTENMLTPRTS